METIVEKCKEMKRLWYCRVLKQRSFARTSTLFSGHSYYYLAAVRAAVARGVAARASVARGVAARAATDCCLHAQWQEESSNHQPREQIWRALGRHSMIILRGKKSQAKKTQPHNASQTGRGG